MQSKLPWQQLPTNSLFPSTLPATLQPVWAPPELRGDRVQILGVAQKSCHALVLANQTHRPEKSAPLAHCLLHTPLPIAPSLHCQPPPSLPLLVTSSEWGRCSEKWRTLWLGEAVSERGPWEGVYSEWRGFQKTYIHTSYTASSIILPKADITWNIAKEQPNTYPRGTTLSPREERCLTLQGSLLLSMAVVLCICQWLIYTATGVVEWINLN